GDGTTGAVIGWSGMRGSTLDRPKMQRGRDTAETRDGVGPLRVWVILMQFPVPAETFAGTDVLALRDHGAVVDVHALRPAHRASDQMVRERGLGDLPISHNT